MIPCPLSCSCHKGRAGDELQFAAWPKTHSKVHNNRRGQLPSQVRHCATGINSKLAPHGHLILCDPSRSVADIDYWMQNCSNRMFVAPGALVELYHQDCHQACRSCVCFSGRRLFCESHMHSMKLSAVLQLRCSMESVLHCAFCSTACFLYMEWYFGVYVAFVQFAQILLVFVHMTKFSLFRSLVTMFVD